MYLYFDKKGVLREIISTESFRQGNAGINKLYVYVDQIEYSSIDAAYLLPSGKTTEWIQYTEKAELEIPFNENRDLKYFEYDKPYQFTVVEMEEDENEVSPFDEAGLVHCSLSVAINNGRILQLGDLQFNVAPSYTRK